MADKRLQTAVAKILEAIDEQDFLSCSFGYRPGTGAHKAIKDLSAVLRTGRYAYVVEAGCSQKRSYTWTGFKALLKDFRLAKPRICHDF